MFDWRFAAWLTALIVLYPLATAAQTPPEPEVEASAAAKAGPGIDTREPQTAPASDPVEVPADTPASEASAAPASDDAEPAEAEAAAEPATAQTEDDESAVPPADASRVAEEESASSDSPAAGDTADAARENAPVAQPMQTPAGEDLQTIPGEQAAEPAPTEAPPRPEEITITVATWQSAYNEAQKRVILEPFSEDTGYKLAIMSHGGDFNPLDAVTLADRGWDLIELNALTAQRGCNEGWLARISPSDLPESVEGDPAEADYLPGGLLPCAAASAAWSAVAVFDQRARFDAVPDSIGALFDLPQFPGKRALPSQAPYLLEFALLADGVAPDKVYEVLGTPAGQDRAFAKLSSIRHAIVWWSDPATALDVFPAGAPDGAEDVVMGIAFNGRVFTSVVRSRGSLQILWDGQVYQFNYWAIPEGASEPDAARALLRSVSLPERQARLTQWFPYGPPRMSALPLVGRHAEMDLDMAAFVPTMPRNLTGALLFDPAWWDAHGTALKQRFARWLALPAPSAPADQFIPPAPVKAERAQPVVTIQ